MMRKKKIEYLQKDMNFLSFAKNMAKNIGTNISKSLRGKYSQRLIDHTKQSAINALKTHSKSSSRTEEATGDLVGKKNADKTTKISMASPQNSLQTVNNWHNKEMPRRKM